MSAKSPPTDPSEDCNELSTQNGGATAPVTESGASVSMRDEALKTTSPSDRVPTTGNAAAAVNETNASQVSRIKGNESLKDKIERCNFDSSESINEVFPPYKGKGTNDVPPELLFFCQSDAAKARIVQGWRNYSENQQLQKISKIVETRQREERAAEAARAALDSEESPPEEEEGRGKRKRKKSVKLLQQEKDEEEKEQAKAGNAPPKKKKRRPNKERTPAQKDLSAVKKKSREQRRNTKRREDAKKAREAAAAKKATSEREQRLAKNVITGPLVQSDAAATASLSNAALQSTKNHGRTKNTKPTNAAQMNDKTALRTEEIAFRGSLKFSETNAPRDEDAAKIGGNPKHTQVVISFNNTHHMQADRLGGQAKKSGRVLNTSTAPPPAITIGAVGGEDAFRELLVHLYEAGALECLRSRFTEQQQVVERSPNLTFISSTEEADTFYAEKKNARKRAPKGRESEDVIADLGEAVSSQTLPLRPRNTN